MNESDDIVLLDAEDRSLSVAQARHLARVRMLIPALDELFEMGMNRGNRTADRVTALKEVIKFASEAQTDGSKQVGKLSPEAARLLLKHGLAAEGGLRGVLPAQKEEARVVSGEVDSEGERGDGGGIE